MGMVWMKLIAALCLSQFQLGTSPGKFFERANPGHPSNFLSNSRVPGKNDGRLGGGGDFPKLEETPP